MLQKGPIILSAKCGNGRMDPGEQCDCGPSRNCNEVDPCCDASTCMLKIEAECASGPCCDKCFVSIVHDIIY